MLSYHLMNFIWFETIEILLYGFRQYVGVYSKRAEKQMDAARRASKYRPRNDKEWIEKDQHSSCTCSKQIIHSFGSIV